MGLMSTSPDSVVPLEARLRLLRRRRRRANMQRILAITATAVGLLCALLVGIGLLAH